VVKSSLDKEEPLVTEK
jgi:exonuclease III